jgi:hypothetical protein
VEGLQGGKTEMTRKGKKKIGATKFDYSGFKGLGRKKI